MALIDDMRNRTWFMGQALKSLNFWKFGVVAVLIALVAALTACGDKSTPVPIPLALQGTTVEVESETLGAVSVTTFDIPTDVPVSIESPEGDVVVVLESATIEESAELKFTPLPEAAIEELPELPEVITSVTRVFEITIVAAEPAEAEAGEPADADAVEEGAAPAFLKPLTITVRYEESDLVLADGNPNNLGILHLADEEWTPLLTTADVENSTLSAQVESLSLFGLGISTDVEFNVLVPATPEPTDVPELAADGDQPGEQPAPDAEAATEGAETPGEQLAEPAQEVGPAGPGGPSGPQGDPGPAGPQGSSGSTGSQGPPGATGSQGAPGTAGLTGAQGSQGLPGEKGEPGLQGVAGTPGIPRTTGRKG